MQVFGTLDIYFTGTSCDIHIGDHVYQGSLNITFEAKDKSEAIHKLRNILLAVEVIPQNADEKHQTKSAGIIRATVEAIRRRVDVAISNDKKGTETFTDTGDVCTVLAGVRILFDAPVTPVTGYVGKMTVDFNDYCTVAIKGKSYSKGFTMEFSGSSKLAVLLQINRAISFLEASPSDAELTHHIAGTLLMEIALHDMELNLQRALMPGYTGPVQWQEHRTRDFGVTVEVRTATRGWLNG